LVVIVCPEESHMCCVTHLAYCIFKIVMYDWIHLTEQFKYKLLLIICSDLNILYFQLTVIY
jgi:hypothetical protein